MRTLLVEDDARISNFVAKGLRENAYAVDTAADGENALYLASINDYVKEDQAKIFDRFYRSDKARTRDNTNGKNGVGLGLSIAAWIAVVHHGSVKLKKSDSDGSVFQVTLPRQKLPC